ncbi:porin family protein [Flavobacterium enshiense]|uniref:porin family protein n=1 Tax=Flavobacterium enshiense TaxID=1341165 RepID=UPI00345DAA6D
MKKYLVAALFTFALLQGVNAQMKAKPGLKAGLNFSNFTNTETNTKTDFYVGGLVALKFTKFYTLQPEFVYSRQGAKADYVVYNPLYTGTPIRHEKYHIDYMSFAAFNKFTFGKGFHAGVGPTLDFRIGDNFHEMYIEEPQDFDLGLIFGGGYSLPNGLTFEARFKQGFVDIFGNDYNNYSDQDNDGDASDVVLNQVFQLGVSYTFDIK